MAEISDLKLSRMNIFIYACRTRIQKLFEFFLSIPKKIYLNASPAFQRKKNRRSIIFLCFFKSLCIYRASARPYHNSTFFSLCLFSKLYVLIIKLSFVFIFTFCIQCNIYIYKDNNVYA